MTKTEYTRQQWQETYKKHGKGSPEEIAAYQAYIKEKQGEGKKSRKARSYLSKREGK